MNFEGTQTCTQSINLREGSQSPRAIHCMISFIQKVQSRQIHKNKKQIYGFQGLEVEEIENNYLMGFSGGNDRKCVFFFNVFVYFCNFWQCQVFTAVQAFPLVAMRGSYSPVAMHGLLIAVDSLVEHRLWAHTGFSSWSSQALEHRLSSCGTWAQLLHNIWDLPTPGIKPMSPALASGFFTTEPPGKP